MKAGYTSKSCFRLQETLELDLKLLLLANCNNNRDSNKVVVKSTHTPGLVNFVAQELEELFSSLVPLSKNGDLYPLMPPRARKVKTAAVLLCSLRNVGSCKNHMNYLDLICTGNTK